MSVENYFFECCIAVHRSEKCGSSYTGPVYHAVSAQKNSRKPVECHKTYISGEGGWGGKKQIWDVRAALNKPIDK